MAIAQYKAPKKKKKKSSFILKIAVISLFAVVSLSIAANFVQLKEVETEKAELQAQLESYEEDIADLEEKMLEENLDSVVEEIAREEYGMLKDGEVVYSSENF